MNPEWLTAVTVKQQGGWEAPLLFSRLSSLKENSRVAFNCSATSTCNYAHSQLITSEKVLLIRLLPFCLYFVRFKRLLLCSTVQYMAGESFLLYSSATKQQEVANEELAANSFTQFIT